MHQTFAPLISMFKYLRDVVTSASQQMKRKVSSSYMRYMNEFDFRFFDYVTYSHCMMTVLLNLYCILYQDRGWLDQPNPVHV